MKFEALAVSLLFTAVMCVGATSHAASADSDLQLIDAIRFTLANNPQFRIYELREQGLTGELETANLKPALRISAEVENFSGTGDLNWFHGSEFTLALSQVIEMGGKQAARTDIVSQRQNTLHARQRILELDLLSDVTARFIELAAVQQRQQLLARRTALADATLSQVTTRVEAGRAPDAERSRAAADLALAQLAEQSAGYSLTAAQVSLSALWGELQPQFNRVEADFLTIEPVAPVQSLLMQLEQNPAIELFASEARVRQAQLREIESRRSTNIEVTAGIRHLAELNDTAFMFGINAPLGNRSRQRGAITTAQASLLGVDAERDAALLRMRVQLLRLDQQRQAAVSEFNTLQNSVIPQLTEALDSTRAAFDSGRYSYLELSAAQAALLDAEQALIEAAARTHLLRVDIERLSGEPLTQQTRATSTDTGGVTP